MLRHSLVKVLLMALIWCSAPVMLFAQGQTVTVDGVAYEVGFLTGSFSQNRSDLTNTTTAPWYGNAGLALTFAEAYKSQVGTAPLIANSLNTLNFMYSGSFDMISGYSYNYNNEIDSTLIFFTNNLDNSSGAFAYVSASTPITTPTAPTNLVATVGDGQVSVAFTAPTDNGGSAITDYEYQLDDGSFVSAGTTTSPVVITGLTNGTSYNIKLRAVNAAGDGAESSAVTSTPITTTTAPTNLVATVGDGQVSVAFTAPTDNGGSAITDYEYQLDDGSFVSAGTTTSPVVITGLTNGTSYNIKLRAVNAAGAGAESAAVTANTPSPLSEFAANEAEIRAVIVNDAAQSLSSNLSINRRMTQEARDRFIEGRRQMADQASALASRNNVPFDIDGSFEMKGLSLTTRGNFFEQTGNYEGTYRRLFFGDFDVQHDADTDSTTATLTARVAWEHLITDQTMMGYFVGGELARSTINGTFDGDQDRLGLTIGGYAVHELVDQVYFDSFLTFGAGRNDLEMDNNVLALTSDYTTRTATAGAALSNVYEYQRYEFHPELAFSYGKTWIDDVDFTGRAYGLVDNTLSLDAGTVSITNLTLRPEVIWALDGDTVATSNSQLGFAPRLICESRETVGRTEDCGGGAELSLSSVSEDGLSAAEFLIILDRVGSSNRSSFTLNLKHRF